MNNILGLIIYLQSCNILGNYSRFVIINNIFSEGGFFLIAFDLDRGKYDASSKNSIQTKHADDAQGGRLFKFNYILDYFKHGKSIKLVLKILLKIEVLILHLMRILGFLLNQKMETLILLFKKKKKLVYLIGWNKEIIMRFFQNECNNYTLLIFSKIKNKSEKKGLFLKPLIDLSLLITTRHLTKIFTNNLIRQSDRN